MQEVNSIIECLERNSIERPNDIAYEFVTDLSLPAETITYGQLYADVKNIAANLVEKVGPGNCLLLLYPPSIEYVKAFFACVMAGVVAVPLYPPKKNAKSDKIFIVAQASQAKYAMMPAKEQPAVEQFWQANSDYQVAFINTQQLIDNQAAADVVLPEADKSKPAFLQYTSGSTGNPKGVIITQGNILANTQYLERISGADSRDVFVNWLPLFHDLGLVTAILLPAYMTCRSVLMAPATFVRNPVVWLKAMTKFGGTVGGAPNFAFDLCTDKIADADLADVDLSKWRIAYNAAEPVKYETLKRFAERFAPQGFNIDSFYPAYGMAESTAFISGGHGEDKLDHIYIDKKALADNKVVKVDADNEDQIAFVGNGLTDEYHHLRIVDGNTKEVLPEGQIGEVWFNGPSVSPGYWLLDDVTKEAFGNTIEAENDKSFLKTGDLGFIIGKHIYITGRSKDMMILNGKNFYPQDIEATVKYCHQDIHPGYTAAFEVDESLVIVTEVNRNAIKQLDPQALVQQIARSVYTEHNVSVENVILLPPYKIPMTSSGKIRRRTTKQLYQAGKLVSLYQKVNTADAVKPENEVEQAIHGIWSKVLGIDEICVKRGFFELGGDSINAMEIAAKVNDQYKSLKLDESKILECISIREMSQFVTLSLLKNSAPVASEGAIRI